MVHPLYRKATWITIGLVIFHELAGSNAISLYSNTMLQEMSSDGAGFTPRSGSYMIGVSGCVAAGSAAVFIKIFKRRQLLVAGHILMALCHFAIAIFDIERNDWGVLIMMIAFIGVYQISNGPVIWLYSNEVVVDTALAICILFLWGTVLLLSLTFNFLMESALKSYGVFFLLGGISLVGSLYCYFFI